MVQVEIVQRCCGVLIVELDHLDSVSERIDWHLFTLSDCDVLLILVFNAMPFEESDRTEMSLNTVLVLEVGWAQTGHLHIEKLSSIKHSLFLLSRHLIEEVGVIGVLDEVDAAASVLVLLHVLQVSFLGLLGTDPGAQRVAHQEHWEMLFDFESGVFGVSHSNYKGTFVGLISYRKLRVARKINTV